MDKKLSIDNLTLPPKVIAKWDTLTHAERWQVLERYNPNYKITVEDKQVKRG